jgi:hypothetical protein
MTIRAKSSGGCQVGREKRQKKAKNPRVTPVCQTPVAQKNLPEMLR